MILELVGFYNYMSTHEEGVELNSHITAIFPNAGLLSLVCQRSVSPDVKGMIEPSANYVCELGKNR